jgi:hypothetical protein
MRTKKRPEIQTVAHFFPRPNCDSPPTPRENLLCVFFPLQNLSASIHLSSTTITIKSNKNFFVSLLIFIERNLVVLIESI